MEWLSKIVPGNAPDGNPILSVIGKKTYRFANGKAAIEDDQEQIPFTEADEFWGEGKPQTDAMKLESDLVAFKPMTDVILIGKAHSPRAAKVPFLDVGIQIGASRKIARILGNRKAYVTATGIDFTPPEPFSEMPLDFSRAYGGSDLRSDEGLTYTYLKNPVGRGFVIRNHPKAIQDLQLPNIEDPQRPLTPQNLALGKFEKWRDAPDPVAFGYQNKNSHPRFTLAGLPPDQWAQAEAERLRSLKGMAAVGVPGAPIPPRSAPMLNPLFFNGAPRGMCLPPMRGDETIKLAHIDRDSAQFSFTLPGIRPKAWIDVGDGREELAMSLHTAVIYKETNQLALVWRGCAYYAGIDALRTFTAFECGVEG